ncbi:hypothetical protein NDU88_003140 [Pleurodeles waltl]|uniref:Uncharacterized protein n=1 Tax=Pleurodeles waltl TaxID=8319 RepID=A0AAV7TMP9_PLEWA|nr:hypothetical protein NDU88_003140 [Pleurodeles waltl]
MLSCLCHLHKEEALIDNGAPESDRSPSGPPSLCRVSADRQDQDYSQESQPLDNKDKLDAILQVIVTSRTSVEMKIEELHAKFRLLRDDQRKLISREIDTERTLSDIPQLEAQVKCAQNLTEHLKKLEDHTKDAEGNARCNNIQVIGLTEGLEDYDAMIPYLEIGIWSSTLTMDISCYFSFERAHQSPTSPLPSVVACLLHYRDRASTMQAAGRAAH